MQKTSGQVTAGGEGGVFGMGEGGDGRPYGLVGIGIPDRSLGNTARVEFPKKDTDGRYVCDRLIGAPG